LIAQDLPALPQCFLGQGIDLGILAESPERVSQMALGVELRTRGEFTKARELDEESIGLFQKEFGPVDSQTLRVMQNLASDYGRCCQYGRARELFRQVFLLMSEPAAGVSPGDLLTAWSGLAWVVRCSGSYTEARDVGEDASDYARENVGPEHLATLRSLIGLSITLRLTGNADEEALEIASQVHGVCQRVRGENHPDTLAAAINLANMQRTMGQIDEALKLTEETVRHYPDIFGETHPYTYGCNGNLALLLRLKGDPAGARRLNESALAGLDLRLTRDHDYSLAVAMNLASDLAALGEADQARALGEDTLERIRRVLGTDHPFALGCAANLALDLRADGAEDLADSLSAETASRYAAVLGADHRDARIAAAGQRLNVDFDPPFI